jgi:hypothetical protein
MFPIKREVVISIPRVEIPETNTRRYKEVFEGT